ncbi:DUF3515 family protein [Agilicoccus flavus]|uniref:DUF3515 family protein n=1 Tax=Agilicoccus flavus TaxID=2775968 RepID=UPI001CF688BE|nr:DUF3515 family protein [Agilicoccus flavus]
MARGRTSPRRATVGLGRRTVALVAVAAAALAGCASPVEAGVPAGARDPGCARVAAAWPATVGGRERREVRADTPDGAAGVAAWGDPAIVARCGVSPPGPTTNECLDVDGVDWVVERLEGGTAFTTYGRVPALEVLVPAEYAPEPLVLGSLGQAARAVPQSERRCS